MSKPRTKKAAYLNEKIARLDAMKTLDPKYKRQQRRILKRKRNKHLRTLDKKELVEMTKELSDGTYQSSIQPAPEAPNL